jgi:hypothetical protein
VRSGAERDECWWRARGTEVEAEEVVVDACRREPAKHPHCRLAIIVVIIASSSTTTTMQRRIGDKHGRVAPARLWLLALGLHL